MIRSILTVLIFVTALLPLRAGEGMWLPLLLSQLNEAEMQSMGMKMTAEDIYSVNQGSLKDAIVHFGGFCTAEIISEEGLLLTNFHCGEGRIQSHSTLENNYLETGFWAMDRSQELPNQGLFATFIVRIEDITAAALAGVTDDLPEGGRQSTIDVNIRKIQSAVEKEDYQDVLIRPFFEGNQYFLFITETYRDVRLVGSPPASIGEFGVDTDNWVWPRHTGDFSLFRIYAGPDNKPAAYSPDNVPLQPRHSLPISLDGVAPDDFTLVFGFPGRTSEYLPSPAVELTVDVLHPARIAVRERTLGILDEAMRADREVRLQYTSKQSGLSNSYKRWIGEIQGIRRTNAIKAIQKDEAEFVRRLKTKPEWVEMYGGLLPKFQELYKKQAPYAEAEAYISEITGRNSELFRLANILRQYYRIYENNGPEALEQRKDRLISFLENFYQDYRPEIDRRVMAALLEIYFNQVDPAFLAPYAVEEITAAGKDYTKLAGVLFQRSRLDESSFLDLVRKDPIAALKAAHDDYAYRFCRAILETNEEKVAPVFDEIDKQLGPLQRLYMQAQLEVFSDRTFYPDANSTLRVTYGKVAGYEARDAVQYEPVTYLSGVMEKYRPGDYEFDVPEKLRELYAQKNYGPYGENDRMPVCFIGTNHTTGGNSGSPAIDAHGNLIGLNFDRAWEGVMSDLYYDASICRNIMVDIRYVLFIIDKFAEAGHLIEEMKLVHPKKP